MLRFTRDWQLPDYLRSLEGARAYGLPISKKYTALQFYNAYADVEGTIVYFIARKIDDTRHVLLSYDLDVDLIVYENGQYLFDETKCFDGYLPDGVYFFEFNDGYETYRSQIFNVTDFPLLPMASGAELASSSELVSSGSVEIPDTIILRRFEVDSDYYQFEN
jgi:hypothetical protein